MRLSFIPLILFLNLSAFAQSGDAGSGWKNYFENVRQFIETKKKWAKDEINSHAQLTNIIEAVKLAREANQITGQIMATGRELKNLTEKFNRDFTNIDMITRGEVEMVNRMVGFQDALSGNGYRPLFELNEAYDASTAAWRAPDGSMSVASWLRNGVDNDSYMRSMRQYNFFFQRTQQLYLMNTDARVREKLNLARSKDSLARMETLFLNMKVFGNTLKLMEARVKKIAKNEPGLVKEDQIVDHNAIRQARQRIIGYLEEASQARAEALRLMMELRGQMAYDILEANDRWAYRQAKAKGPAWRPKNLAEETNLWVPKDKLGTF